MTPLVGLVLGSLAGKLQGPAIDGLVATLRTGDWRRGPIGQPDPRPLAQLPPAPPNLRLPVTRWRVR